MKRKSNRRYVVLTCPICETCFEVEEIEVRKLFKSELLMKKLIENKGYIKEIMGSHKDEMMGNLIYMVCMNSLDLKKEVLKVLSPHPECRWAFNGGYITDDIYGIGYEYC